MNQAHHYNAIGDGIVNLALRQENNGLIALVLNDNVTGVCGVHQLRNQLANGSMIKREFEGETFTRLIHFFEPTAEGSCLSPLRSLTGISTNQNGSKGLLSNADIGTIIVWETKQSFDHLLSVIDSFRSTSSAQFNTYEAPPCQAAKKE